MCVTKPVLFCTGFHVMFLNHLCKDQWQVIAPYKISLYTADRQERKVIRVTASIIFPQMFEEERQEFLIFKARGEVPYADVIQEQHALMVDIIKVLSHTGLRRLSLNVRHIVFFESSR